MPRKNTAVQLMSAMRRLFQRGYQSINDTSNVGGLALSGAHAPAPPKGEPLASRVSPH